MKHTEERERRGKERPRGDKGQRETNDKAKPPRKPRKGDQHGGQEIPAPKDPIAKETGN